MLVLTRKAGETLVIGNGIQVTIASVRGNRVKIAIDAPPECAIRRAEIATSNPASQPTEAPIARRQIAQTR